MNELLKRSEMRKWGYRQPVILVESQSAPILFGDLAEQAYMRGCNIAVKGDLVVTDFPLNEQYIYGYLGDVLGFDLPDYLVAANVGSGCLSTNLVAPGNQVVFDAIVEWWKKNGEKAKLQFFNVTPHESNLAVLMGIESTCGNLGVVLEVGSKPGFRKLAEELGLPMPRGFVCTNLAQTVEAVTAVIEQGYDALIKAENGTGGSELKSNISVPKEILRSDLVAQVENRLDQIDGFLGGEWVVEERVGGEDGSIHVFIADETTAEKSSILGAISVDDSYVGGYYPFVPNEQQRQMMTQVDEVLVPALQQLGVFGHHCLDFKGQYFLEDNVRPGALDFIDGMVEIIAAKHFGNKSFAYWHCHVGTSGPTDFAHVWEVLSDYLDPAKAPEGYLAMVTNQEVLPFGRSLDLTAINFGDDASVNKAREFFTKLEMLVKEKL